jgi:hypothetical protein
LAGETEVLGENLYRLYQYKRFGNTFRHPVYRNIAQTQQEP